MRAAEPSLAGMIRSRVRQPGQFADCSATKLQVESNPEMRPASDRPRLSFSWNWMPSFNPSAGACDKYGREEEVDIVRGCSWYTLASVMSTGAT
jgi:hypothetical protein